MCQTCGTPYLIHSAGGANEPSPPPLDVARLAAIRRDVERGIFETYHAHDYRCEPTCSPEDDRSLARQRFLLAHCRAMEGERDDARQYVAEIAQGMSHYPHDADEPCVRCQRDLLAALLAALRARPGDAMTTHRCGGPLVETAIGLSTRGPGVTLTWQMVPGVVCLVCGESIIDRETARRLEPPPLVLPRRPSEEIREA